jgi:hypothetical protein
MKSFQFPRGVGYKLVCHAPKWIPLSVGCRPYNRDGSGINALVFTTIAGNLLFIVQNRSGGE